MFNIFKSVKVQLDLKLDRQIYAPGDTIYAHITLQNEKEFNIQGGRFTLTCQQKYQYKRKHRDSNGHTSVDTTWGTHDTQVFRFDFLPEMILQAGTQTFETSFTLEADSLPSAKGDILSVTWFARATLDRKLAADTNSEVEITVVTANPPDVASAPIGQEYGLVNEPDEVRMTFLLNTKEVTGGARLAGRLRIFPLKDFTANEVRLALTRDEYVSDVSETGYENKKEIVVAEVKLAGKTPLQTGQYQEFPFTLDLPPAMAPSVQFNVGALTYRLQGILARTLRKDTRVEEEVRVYSG